MAKASAFAKLITFVVGQRFSLLNVDALVNDFNHASMLVFTIMVGIKLMLLFLFFLLIALWDSCFQSTFSNTPK